MKALICRTLSEDFSGLEMAEARLPQPGLGEVLVKVAAASLNYPDLLLCQGRYQLKLAPPFIPGMDISGHIAALGPGVEGFETGQSVCGGIRYGGFAEYACVRGRIA